MKKKGFGAFEMTIAVFIILALIYLFVPKYENVLVESKAVVREKEIKEFQNAIIYYRLKNKRFPENLRVLVDEGYIEFKEESKKERVSENGIFDPFGLEYLYDKKNGEIKINEN